MNCRWTNIFYNGENDRSDDQNDFTSSTVLLWLDRQIKSKYEFDKRTINFEVYALFLWKCFRSFKNHSLSVLYEAAKIVQFAINVILNVWFPFCVVVNITFWHLELSYLLRRIIASIEKVYANDSLDASEVFTMTYRKTLLMHRFHMLCM